jgi:hypothetical protein
MQFSIFKRGVSLYLALIIMFILIAIGLGVSLIIVSQMKMMKGMGDSVVAFYAADTGIEHALYNKRVKGGTGNVSGNLDANTSYSVTSNTETGTWDSVGNFKVGISPGVKRSIEITIPGCATVIGGTCSGLSETDCTNCSGAGCQWVLTGGSCSGTNSGSCGTYPACGDCCVAFRLPNGIWDCKPRLCSQISSDFCEFCGCTWTSTYACSGTLNCPNLSPKTNCNSCTQCQWIF